MKLLFIDFYLNSIGKGNAEVVWLDNHKDNLQRSKTLGDCPYMKLNTLEKLYLCMKYEMPEIKVDEQLRVRAEKAIRRMLEISKKTVAA